MPSSTAQPRLGIRQSTWPLATDSAWAADRLRAMVSLARPYATHNGVNGVIERVGALIGG
jgi:hypothetical protein